MILCVSRVGLCVEVFLSRNLKFSLTVFFFYFVLKNVGVVQGLGTQQQHLGIGSVSRRPARNNLVLVTVISAWRVSFFGWCEQVLVCSYI